MICLLSLLFLASTIAAHSFSENVTLKIVSPLPGSSVKYGSSLNITLQLSEETINSSHQVVLGFGLNAEWSENSKALGDIFLGLLNTSQTNFSKATGQLSWILNIPSKEKFNSTSASYSLVVSQYMFSGPSNIPHCGIVSVPVNLTGQSQPSDPSGYNGAKSTSANLNQPGWKEPKPTGSHGVLLTANVPKQELNATISAKGHNTGETIPGTANGASSIPASKVHPPAPMGNSSTPQASGNPANKTSHANVTSGTNTTGTSEPTSGADSQFALFRTGIPMLAYISILAMIL